MPLEVAEQKSLIVAELGQATGAFSYIPQVTSLVDKLWEKYSSKAFIHYDAQYLFVQRHVVLYLMGQNWRKYDWQEADEKKAESQVIKNLSTILVEVKSEIASMDREVVNYNTNTTKRTTVTRPIDYTGMIPDPGNARYRGTPIGNLIDPVK